MPEHRFQSKSKADLVVVATLAGILPPAEAERRSKTELIALLEAAERSAAAARSPAPAEEPPVSASPTAKRRGRPKSPTPDVVEAQEAAPAPAPDTRPIAVVAEPEPTEALAPKAAASRKGRPPRRTTLAEPVAAPSELEAPMEIPAAPSLSVAPASVPVSEPSASESVPAPGIPAASRRIGRAHRPARPSGSDSGTETAAGPTPSAVPQETLSEAVATPVPEPVPQSTGPEAAPTPAASAEVPVEPVAAEGGQRAPDRGHVRPEGPGRHERRPHETNLPQVPDRNRGRHTEPQARRDATDRRPERVQRPGPPVRPDRPDRDAMRNHPARPDRPENRQKDVARPDGRPGRRQEVRVRPGTVPEAVMRLPLPSSDDAQQDEYLRSQALVQGNEATGEGTGQDEASRRPPLESGEMVEGVLELMPDGYGFLRRENYLQSNRDIYVPPQYIRRFNLRNGDFVTGPGKVQRESDRFQALLYIKEVNGQPPENMMKRPTFDKLTPIYPDQRFALETVRNELSTRIIDLVAPIGKGQRGMIVSPPKAGKTILLQKIANAISKNNPEAKLIVLLIDERPEEVTDMQRSINGEVVYSTFDKSPDNHVKVAELVLDRAMRLVELGQDVVILMDSMTRLARAYNLTIQPTGRTLSGGLDPGALQGPKRFFGAARNIEFGGSLTIIATSLIETGSRMDEVIFEEFKGTGNMEVYLDRKLSEKRIFPAIDINKSGTRREELLLSSRELDAVWTIRKAFSQLDTAAVTEMIINLLLKTTTNSHFVSSVNVTLNDKAVFEAMRGTRPGSNGLSSGGSGGYSSSGGYRSPVDD